jgi:inorganic phosphate transporter, PiT family
VTGPTARSAKRPPRPSLPACTLPARGGDSPVTRRPLPDNTPFTPRVASDGNLHAVGSELIPILVIVAAVAFDFTNGFHDTANAMATSIATGALKPRVAVMISAVLNFAGAFISISVAATIAKGIVDPKVLAGDNGLALVLAALLGAMTSNLITWYFTIPSSSSHALIGGVIGATIVASSASAVNGRNLVQSVITPAILSPIICGAAAVTATFIAYRLIRRLGRIEAISGYRFGQIGSASLVSLAHGTNDAQTTMGVISLVRWHGRSRTSSVPAVTPAQS